MIRHETTLTQFLIEERRRYPDASGGFNSLLLAVALACKTISRKVAYGALADMLGSSDAVNTHGETQQRLDLIAHETFTHCAGWGGNLAGLISEEADAPIVVATDEHDGREYLLAFDPLDGSSNIDVNVSVGSIFSILRAPAHGRPVTAEDFLQPGERQVAAGYAIYGPSTMLVLSVGRGVHMFTLEPEIGEFILTRSNVTVPEQTSEFAINASNSRFWQPPVRRYVEECLAGRNGVRDRDFNMRWIASLVAEAHRILTRGGLIMYPRDTKDPKKKGRLRLLYECNPIGFLIEQAGGRASTGSVPVLGVKPESIHERMGFVFGSRAEVERIERYHAEDGTRGGPDTPLFNARGLFRDAA
ncbi:MAG: class 1 fructose-bisphosphatase [Burkholderiaceae bacterium]